MEDKVICYYCGTVYDKTRGKCPLCGSSLTSEEEPRPVQHRRITEQERRARRQTAKGKYAASKKKKARQADPKPFQIAALVFLILAVLVVLYFIGDMIGWWPGLEDRIVRQDVYRNETISDACEELTLDTERIEFAAPGDTAILTASVNLNCGKTMYCTCGDESVAVVSEQADSDVGAEQKTVAFTVTAVGPGETEIEITCGSKRAVCAVVCGAPEASSIPDPSDASDASELTEAPQEITLPDDFVPELNYPLDASLFAKGATLMLRVLNLPAGMKVDWTSDDVTIAKVSENGIVTAISGGMTKVTAQVGDQTAQVRIRCSFGDNPDCGAHLELTDVTLSLSRNETYALYLYDSNSVHITDITYTVEDPDVCEVKDSVITPKQRGTTNVIVTYGENTYTCIVRVS